MSDMQMAETSLAEKQRRTQFLGREFLTWLMVKTAIDGSFFKLGDKDIDVSFLRAITLDGENPAREKSTIKVDDPTHSEEIQIALRLGKKVSKAMLFLSIDGAEYQMVVDAGTMTLRSVKLPELKGMDPIEVMEERVDRAGEAESAIHLLFGEFMRLRLDGPNWEHEVGAVANWIMNGSTAEEYALEERD